MAFLHPWVQLDGCGQSVLCFGLLPQGQKGQTLPRENPNMARVQRPCLREIIARGWEILSQKMHEGALVPALGIGRTVINQFAQGLYRAKEIKARAFLHPAIQKGLCRRIRSLRPKLPHLLRVILGHALIGRHASAFKQSLQLPCMIRPIRAGIYSKRDRKTYGGKYKAHDLRMAQSARRSSHIPETDFLDCLHRDKGRGAGHMRQRRNLFPKYAPIGLHIAGAHFQQIVEIARNHMGLLDFLNLGNRLIERL